MDYSGEDFIRNRIAFDERLKILENHRCFLNGSPQMNRDPGWFPPAAALRAAVKPGQNESGRTASSSA
jgi:hypothetical protein